MLALAAGDQLALKPTIAVSAESPVAGGASALVSSALVVILGAKTTLMLREQRFPLRLHCCVDKRSLFAHTWHYGVLHLCTIFLYLFVS